MHAFRKFTGTYQPHSYSAIMTCCSCLQVGLFLFWLLDQILL